MNRFLLFLMALPITLGAFATEQAYGQGVAMISVSFRDEVAPILADRCLRCHGPDEAEADFRVDEQSAMEDFIVAGSPDESDLFLMVTSTEEGYRMPPDSSDHLSEHEIAVLRDWIQVGAKFQDVDNWKEVRFKGTDLAETDTMGEAVWALLGRFHPALIHFPIALLTVAAFLAIFGFGSVHMDKAAVYCLVLGTLGSIVAAASGWGFAEYRKWPPARFGISSPAESAEEEAAAGDTQEESEPEDAPEARAEGVNQSFGETISEQEAEQLGGGAAKDPAQDMVDLQAFTLFDGTKKELHRWGGVGVAVLSLVVTLLALYIRNNPERSQFVWKLSSVVLAGLVGWVGHQGGEIHYGEDLYDGPWARITQLMEEGGTEPVVPDTADSDVTDPADSEDADTEPTTPETEEETGDEDAEEEVPEATVDAVENTEDDGTEEDGTEDDGTEEDGAEGDGAEGDGTEGDGDTDDSE